MKIVAHIKFTGRKAEGAVSALKDDGQTTVHVASGNWLGEAIRAKFCKTAAAEAYPEPQQEEGESDETYAQRCGQIEKTRKVAEKAIKKDLLVALDQLKAEWRQQQSEAESPPDIAAGDDGQEGAGGPYVEKPGGLFRKKASENGASTLQQLTNFRTRIVAEVIRDDGADVERTLSMQGRVGAGPARTFAVKSKDYGAMTWPIEHLGASAYILPGAGTRDHARVAIQQLSGSPPVRTVYTHTGWRHHEGESVFLHAGGAIGTAGPRRDIEVDLVGPLARFLLPPAPTGEDLHAAIRACLKLLALARPAIMVPLVAQVWRAPLGTCDFSVHVAGKSGAFKSELASLMQRHFGAGMDARHLATNWSSTENALDGLAFAAKDALLVVDEFKPQGTPMDVQRWHQKADRVLRAVGNHSGRDRLRADLTLRSTRPPRCTILSTGEEIPTGPSLRARFWVIDLVSGDITPAALRACQVDAAAGVYASAMAAYVQWLAPRYAQISEGLREEVLALRDRAAGSGSHARTPELVANLMLGMRYLLAFARSAGAVSDAAAAKLESDAWQALGPGAGQQADHQESQDEVNRFLDLLRSAIASGRAHLAAADGRSPNNAGAWGWWQRRVGSGMTSTDEWQPQGSRIGWIDEEQVYLDRDAAYKTVQSMAGGGEGLTISAQTLTRRMNEQGLLIREEGRDELQYRKTLQGQRRQVLYLKPGIFHSDPRNEHAAGPAISHGSNGDGLFEHEERAALVDTRFN